MYIQYKGGLSNNIVNVASVQIEYTVPKCLEGESKCIHAKESFAFLPYGGDVVYAVAHQHSGGVGSSLYNEV